MKTDNSHSFTYLSSFMWSFEKLHRCMAHLFLGQLVTTFDEEFRILFAQSQPLMIENVLAQMEEFNLLHKRQHPNEKASLYKGPRRFLSQDIIQPDEWGRHSYDERMDGDWRMVAQKRQDSLRGPADMYRRYASQQPWMDPGADQGPTRMPMMENPAFKRHSYAEGVQDRYSLPFMQQQGMPDTEAQGKYFPKGQQPFPGPGPGVEPNYSGYDKFWNQDYQSTEQYSEPGLPQELPSPDNFDPVLNYLSSTRNLDFDQSSEKLPPAADLPLSSSHPRRLSLVQPYVCQISPTPSNSADQKQFFQDPLTTDRKDPTVKQGLRNWRISSYLNTYENPGEEGLPLAPPQAPEAFEEPLNPIQQTAADFNLPALKIPNVREFKVPAVPRTSQILNYAKTQEQPKKLLKESAAVAAERKTTPTPSESSSTTDREKAEATEQKESKTVGLRRDDSFRRNYNAAVPRSSRLRSSLIFSSLDQQQTPQETSTDQPDEQSDKSEAEASKLQFLSVLGHRRSSPREPFEWSRYVKSATFDNSSTETSKPDDESSKGDDKDSSKMEISKDISEIPEVKEPLKPKDVEHDMPSPSISQFKPTGAEQPVQPPKPLIKSPLYVDMSDPDNRLMFFKELAAKRKAAKATEAAKSKEKVQIKPPADLKNNITSKKEDPPPNVTSESRALTGKHAAESAGKTQSTDESTSPTLSLDASKDTSKTDNLVVSDSSTSQSFCEKEAKVSADSDTTGLDSQSVAPVSAATCRIKSPEEPNTSVKESSSSSTATNATAADVLSLRKGGDERESPKLDSASTERASATTSLAEVTPSILTQNLDSSQLETNFDSSSLPSNQSKGTESSSPNTLLRSSSSGQTLLDSASQSSPSTRAQTLFSEKIPGESGSTVAPSTLFPKADQTEGQKTVSSSLQKSASLSNETQQPALSETPAAADSAHVESRISLDASAANPGTNILSLQLTTKSEEASATISSADGSEKHISKSETDNSGLDISSFSHSVSETGVLNASGLESSAPKHDLKETISPITTPIDTLDSAALTPSLSQSETPAPSGDAPIQTTPPRDLNLTDFDAPTPAETASCSTPQSTAETETNRSAVDSMSDKDTTQPESEESPVQPLTDLSSSPTEPAATSPAEFNLPCKTSESDTPKSHISEPALSDESSKIKPESVGTDDRKSDDVEDMNESPQESVSSEQTNDIVKQSNSSEPTEVMSKQPKLSQSRYHSSTANVLSSSNLRDDTKLLLEQISANCQSRNESTKEPPVTDDEKEDEADKNAKKEKETGFRTFSRGQPKSTQEREKLLERIQSMRKDRKVYSRFEVRMYYLLC